MKARGRQQLIAASAAAMLLLGAASASADVKAGVDAWTTGNYGAAVAQWRPLADRGDPDAQFNLGQAYKLGRGVPTDLRIAQTWYEKAAQQGHSQAQANLGLILFQNGDRAKAMPWIRRAADAGDPRAQYVLGTAMFNGDLVQKDWPRAYALMQRAAAQGLPQAAVNLQQMDKHVPLPQRQQVLALARQMEQKAAAPASVRPPHSAGGVRPASIPPSNSAIQSTVAAPAPIRAPAATPAPAASAGGGWKVQLGAFGNSANAKRHWDAVRAKVGALGSLSPSFEPAGAMTRLKAGPVANRAAADRICAAAKAAGSACFPVAR